MISNQLSSSFKAIVLQTKLNLARSSRVPIFVRLSNWPTKLFRPVLHVICIFYVSVLYSMYKFYVPVLYSMYKFYILCISSIFYVQVLYSIYKFYILYVQILYSMYQFYILCISSIFYVQVLYSIHQFYVPESGQSKIKFIWFSIIQLFKQSGLCLIRTKSVLYESYNLDMQFSSWSGTQFF